MIVGLGLLNQAQARSGIELFEARVGARLVAGQGPWSWRVYTRGVVPPEWRGIGGYEEVVCPPRRKLRGGRLWSEQVSWGWALSRRPVDLLVCLSFFPPRLYRRPFAMTVHDLTALERPGDYPPIVRVYATELLRSLVPRARRLTTPSQWVRERCATLLDFPAERIDVVYSGVEAGYYLERPGDDAGPLLARLGVRGPFWLHCGTPQPRKNLEVVLRALRLMKERGEELPFLVSVGRPSPHSRRLAALARALGVGDRLMLPGRLEDDELGALYRACSAFVYPSWAEGFGVPPLEAMAAGARVVAARATCLPEILGDTPAWADPAEPESWCEAWERLKGESPEASASLRARAREHARRYTWEDTARRWRQSIEAAAGELDGSPRVHPREQPPVRSSGESPAAGRPVAVVLTPRLPWPLDDGGRIGLWQVVSSAARAYRVVLVSLVPPGTEHDALPAPLTELGLEVIRIPHRPPPTALAIAHGLFGPWPHTLARYRSARLEETMRRLVATRHPAFVLVNHLHLATCVGALGEVPMVLREHNLEFSWMERYAESLGGGARWYARLQARRLRSAEAALCRRAALVLAVQDEEAATLRALCPGTPVETVPVGIDLGRFPAPRRTDPPTVLIVGSFAWVPNVRGASRFLAEGWPRVVAAVPAARLRLAGKDPPPEFANAARDAGAEVVGYVPSMEDEFARASALVVPLWVGAGARVKIIEAFAARLPVVSTSVGAEGLAIVPGTHFVRGDSPRELADGLIALLRSPELQTALARAGRLLAEQRWSLEAVAAIQNRLCARVAGPEPASRARATPRHRG